MTSHLQPEIRVDRNGKAVTRHINTDAPTNSGRPLPEPKMQSGLDKMQDASKVIAAAKDYGSDVKDILENVGKLSNNESLKQVAEIFGSANNIAGLGVLLSAKSAKEKMSVTLKAYKKFNEEKSILEQDGSARNERNFRDAEFIFTQASKDLSKEITDNISSIGGALGATVGAAGALPAQLVKIAPLVTGVLLGQHTKKLLPQGTGVIRDLHKIRTEDVMSAHQIVKNWQGELADSRRVIANSAVGSQESILREIALTRIIHEYGERLGISSKDIQEDITEELNDVSNSLTAQYDANNQQYRKTMDDLR